MITRYSEITDIVVDDFRKEVIDSILSMFPGRAIDDEDSSNGIFYMDGIKVSIESDRIVVDDDANDTIPLKNAPIAGNPPQYREVSDIIQDFANLFAQVPVDEEEEIKPKTSLSRAFADIYGVSDTGCYINGNYFSPRVIIQKLDELCDCPIADIMDCIEDKFGDGCDGRDVNGEYMSPDSVLRFLSSQL